MEKNPTIVTFPVKNLDLRDYLKVNSGAAFPSDGEVADMPISELKSILQQYFDELQIWKINDVNSQENSALIKRVVGVGGDVVEIFENGEVFVNSSKFYIPNINEGVNFKNETYVIPDNEIFVLGDNRPNSQDSRYIGTIPISNIIGKAIYLIYPFEKRKY